MVVLTVIDYFLPGFRGGGPTRSLSNLAERLFGQVDFKVLTRDHDACMPEPYHGIARGQWNRMGKCQVMYLSKNELGVASLRTVIGAQDYEVLYLNSLFSPLSFKVLLLRKLGGIPRRTLVLAPRGEFSPGALKLKWFKKRVYIGLIRLFRVLSGAVWHATSRAEEAEIYSWFGRHSAVLLAPNLPALPSSTVNEGIGNVKAPGTLKIAFMSRITRKKNLDLALKILQGVEEKVEFNIFGPQEDPVYWAECAELIRAMPPNVQVRYCGAVEHDGIHSTMLEHDLFFLPTRGENFGHIIVEALLAGRPVLLSDQTPWRDLEEKHVGWDIPLSEPGRFREVIEYCSAMGQADYALWSKGALDYGRSISEDRTLVQKSFDLFTTACETPSGRQKLNEPAGARRLNSVG